jgi:hypothetical protein
VPALWHDMSVKNISSNHSAALNLQISVACNVSDKCFCTKSSC